MIEAIGVIVPVHDEAELLPACLAALDRAVDVAGIPCRVLAVLDACTDGSAAPDAITVAVRSAGAARAAGAAALLAHFADVPRANLWLATTDADSRVPAHWLVDQRRLADDGIDAIAGTIHVDDWSGHPPGSGDRFAQFYEPPGATDAHTHVHGANFGVRADAYLAAGGFAAIRTGEDHALWNALAARRRLSTRRLPVVTSARLVARAPSGFSGFLAKLAS